MFPNLQKNKAPKQRDSDSVAKAREPLFPVSTPTKATDPSCLDSDAKSAPTYNDLSQRSQKSDDTLGIDFAASRPESRTVNDSDLTYSPPESIVSSKSPSK
jgi:hypothetical protein